jgi:hypothetical protein
MWTMGGRTMNMAEAKEYVGLRCEVTFLDRAGGQVTKALEIQDVAYVPLYGAYLIGDIEDVCLDRVSEISEVYA